MKVTNKITGTIQEFELKHLHDFSCEDDYINYVLEMYLKNPWALEQYHLQLNEAEATEDHQFMNTVCQSFQAHKKKVFMKDFVLRKHETINCEINRFLRGK